MEENKDLTPEVENEVKETVEAEGATSTQSETASKSKAKKDKAPMPKKKKQIIIIASVTVAVVILGVIIGLLAWLLTPVPVANVDTIALKVDMGDKYYVGTEGEIDLTKIFPDCKEFAGTGVTGNKLIVSKTEGFDLTFKDKDGKNVTKKVTVIKDAVNVSTFDELKANINDSKAVVVQNAKISAPSIVGESDSISGMTVKNHVYGNGAYINMFEYVASRAKAKDGKIGAIKLEGLGDDAGITAFNIVPTDKVDRIIFQDLHITGNDMDNKNGNLKGLDDKVINKRALRIFSRYADLVSVNGSDDEQAKVDIKYCVVENGHKVVHINKGNVKLIGTIIRNASDTALSIATRESRASYVESKDNVIANSLTGAVLFYSDLYIDPAKADASWNELKIVDGSYLDIYNWKAQNGLAFMPETEQYELVANKIAGSEIPRDIYDDLKVEMTIKKGDKNVKEKFIHFGIVKLRIQAPGGVFVNNSKVTGYEKIGYTTAKDNKFDKFPIPSIAAGIVCDIDVWGYYSNNKGIKPTDGFDDTTLAKYYKSQRDLRNKEAA